MISRPDPVDWPLLIAELQSRGYSLRKIGAEIDVPHSSVQRWAEGAVPNHADGAALLLFFTLVRDRVPIAKERALPSRA